MGTSAKSSETISNRGMPGDVASIAPDLEPLTMPGWMLRQAIMRCGCSVNSDCARLSTIAVDARVRDVCGVDIFDDP